MRRFAAVVGVAVAALLTVYAAPSADQPSDRPSGRLVLSLLSPERVSVVDIRSGRTSSKRLPGGTLCHGSVVVTGGRIVFAGSARPEAVSIDLDLKGPVRSVGAADQWLASATDGRLWLATFHRRRWAGTVETLREVTVAGRTTFVSGHQMPAMYWNGAAEDGLVLEHRGTLRVWDPRRGVVVRRMRGSFPIAVQGRRMAWCPPRCRRLRLAGPGVTTRVRPARGLPFIEGAEGAFSPDGSRLALPVGRSQGARLAIVDVDTGSIRSVPDAKVGVYNAVAWSRSGDWLFYATPRNRLMAYQPDSQRTVALPVRLRDTVMSIAAG